MSDLTITKKFDIENLKASEAEKVIICSDISSSMACPFDDGATRADALVEAVKALLQSSDPRRTHYGTVDFSDQIYIPVMITNKYSKILFTLAPRAEGSTNMSGGLRTALEFAPNRIILLSDGEPNRCPDEEIVAATTRSIRIDTIGIGDANGTLMRSIAEATGGKYSTASTIKDLKKVYTQLETKTYYQLTHQSTDIKL